MPYTRGPHALFTSLPVLPRPVLVSARSVNAATKRYELDATTGGNESMPSTAQRVLMLVSFADQRRRFITEQDLAETRALVLTALSVLTDGRSPAIAILSFDVGSENAGSTFLRITYRDLTTGLDQTVQV